MDRYIETVRDAALRHFVAGLLLSGRVTETEVRAATSERIADLLHQEYQRLCTTPRKAVRHGVAAR